LIDNEKEKSCYKEKVKGLLLQIKQWYLVAKAEAVYQ